jgi:AraC family ethanolamine operon transcriptional activator
MIQLSGQEKGAPICFNGCFSDIDEFSQATRGWDLDFRQLAPGNLEASLNAIIQPSAHIMHSKFNRRFLQFGSPPPGTRTFGILDQGIEGVHWYGRNVTDSTLLSFHPTSGFEALSQTDFRCYTLSFTEVQLARISEALGFPDIDDLLDRYEAAHTCENEALTAIRDKLRQIFDATESNPAIARTSGLRNEIEHEIPALLLSTLSMAASEIRKPSMRARRRTLEKAVSFIDEHAEQFLTIEELCRAVGVSWRTLDYAFKEHFEISPKKYLMAVKLNAVQKELRRMGPKSTIANIANRWGFWNMSQFAKDYRKLFGELPSETVNGKSAQ